MAKIEFTEDIPLSKYTTLRVGGCARQLAIARSADEVESLVYELRTSTRGWRVIGQGSNILASDDGTDSAIIVFKDETRPIIEGAGFITVSGGYSLAQLIADLAQIGLSGLEKLAGIPGTVGGAIFGNAGAYGSSIGERCDALTLLSKSGIKRRIRGADLEFGYRHSALKRNFEAVLNVKFKLTRSDPVQLQSDIAGFLADRKVKHPNPVETPTAGSFFKNPLGADGKRIAAGKLLDECGCKELKFGGAYLWPSHANILCCRAGSSSTDVKMLAAEMKKRVKEKFGIELEQEVIELPI